VLKCERLSCAGLVSTVCGSFPAQGEKLSSIVTFPAQGTGIWIVGSRYGSYFHEFETS
jgi:hypothetical protein